MQWNSNIPHRYIRFPDWAYCQLSDIVIDHHRKSQLPYCHLESTAFYMFVSLEYQNSLHCGRTFYINLSHFVHSLQVCKVLHCYDPWIIYEINIFSNAPTVGWSLLLKPTSHKNFLISGTDYSSSVIWTPQLKNFTCPSSSYEQNSLANCKIQ